jgi:hypothetical protein
MQAKPPQSKMDAGEPAKLDALEAKRAGEW